MRRKKWLSTLSATLVLTAAMGLAAFAQEGEPVTPPGEAPETEDVPDTGVPEAEVPEETAPVTESPETDVATIDSISTGDEELLETEQVVQERQENHGLVVSTFAKTPLHDGVLLTGCAKGQAVAAVARGGDPEDAKPCKDGDEPPLTDSDPALDSGTPEESLAADGVADPGTDDEQVEAAGEPGNGNTAKGKGNAKAHGKVKKDR